MLLTMLFTAATAQNAVMIRFAPPVGATVKYRMVNSMAQSMPGAPGGNTMKTTADMSMRFVSRSGANTTIEVTTSGMKLDVPPNSPMAAQKKQMEAQMKAGSKMQVVMDATAKPISVKPIGQANAATANVMQAFSTGMQGVSYPNRAVRVGESWKTTLDSAALMKAAMPSMPAGMKVSGKLPTTTKLVGVKKVGGKNLANLKLTMAGTMTMTMQGQNIVTKVSSTGNCWVEAGTGVTHSIKTVSSSTTSFGGRNLEQKMTMSMTKL
jgi:hypothetical protein